MTALVPSQALKPSGWWYLAVAGLAVGGLIAAIVILRTAWQDAQQAGFDASLAGPGDEQLLTIVEPGGYTIAYIGPIVAYNEADQRELAADLEVSITPAGGGDPLPLADYEGFQDLQQDGAQWVPLQTVHFDEAGEYFFRSSNFADLDDEESVLAVSQSPFRKLRDGAVMAAIVLTVSALLAILVAVILAVTRRRARLARRRQAPWGWPAGPGPGHPGAYPTGYPAGYQGPYAPHGGGPGQPYRPG
jgi:hypothetical protein